MKLVRYGEAGAERPGILDGDGAIRDLSAHIDDIAGDTLAALADLAALDPAVLPIVEGQPRLGPPVGRIGKVICIGLNYADHAAEAGMDVPAEPIVFMKAPSAITGPNDPIILPRGASKVDWEVELAAVIGARARYVPEASALKHVAGFAAFNDVSERAFQLEHGGQWTKGKSHDGFGPLGPWLVTPDEVADPQNLALTLDVNGERLQAGSTRTMVFPVARVVSYLSRFMTLDPGDVIATGTPPGVGMGMSPQRYLAAGDTVELEVEGLGCQRCAVIREAG